MKAILISIIMILSTAPAQAADLEGIIAGTTEYVEGVGTTSGLSARLRFLFNTKASSFYIQSNFPGVSPLLFDVIAGYTVRSSGDFYAEVGGGFRYAYLWGAGFAINAGFGFDLGSSFYIVFPVYYRVGFSIEAIPYIGFRF